jgi:hypothetical protein
MKDNYHESCVCVMAWDETLQEMEANKVHSKHELFWGKPQAGGGSARECQLSSTNTTVLQSTK